MKELHAAVDDHVAHYENGSITISGDIQFSMHKTVRTITHTASKIIGTRTQRNRHALDTSREAANVCPT
jgi:hypothetical protein